TLVRDRAGDRIRAGARPGLAGVAAGARVAVVAGGVVRLGGVGAGAGGGVAGPDVVTLILGRAGDGVRAGARAGLAGVAAGARVAVVAGGAVGPGGVGADPRRRVAGAGVVALVLGVTDDRRAGEAGAAFTGVGDGARVAVVAGGAVRLGGVGAGAGRRGAGAGVVALILRRAQHRRAGGAGAGLAGVGRGARVAVVAGGAVRLDRVGADAARRIAGANVVALVLGMTDDGRGGDTAAAFARVAGRARVAVV